METATQTKPTVTIRPSSTNLFAKCVAAAHGENDQFVINWEGAAGTVGSALHMAAKSLVLKEPIPHDEIRQKYGLSSAQQRDVRIMTACVRKYCLENLHAGGWSHTLVAEQRLEGTFETDKAIYDLGGTIDVGGFSADHTIWGTADWKSTRLETTDYSPQQIMYLWNSKEWIQKNLPPKKWPKYYQYHIVFVRDWTEEVSEAYTAEQLDAWVAGFLDRIESWGGREYHPGGHCFGGETRFLTDDGVRSLRDACGENVRVMNRHGQWEDARVRSFGRQKLYRIKFDDGSMARATAGHLWWQMEKDRRNDGWKQTDHRIPTLEVDRVPITSFAEFPEVNPAGVRHGVVFGDGYLCKERGYCVVTLQPHKAELASWFDDDPVPVQHYPGQVQMHTAVKRRANGTVVVTMQPGHFKDLPDRCSPEYARGFLAGLIATDGCVSQNGDVTVSCEGFRRAKAIAEVARLGGIVVTSVRVTSRTWPETMPGGRCTKGRARELSVIRLKPKTCPIITERQCVRLKAKHQMRRMYRNVVSVDEDFTEEVFCVTVPGSQSFTLANGVATSNCIYCPRQAECPAVYAMVTAMSRALADPEFIPTAEQASDAELVSLKIHAGAVGNLIDGAMGLLKAIVVGRGGQVASPDGCLVTTYRPRYTIDPLLAWPIAEKVLTEQELADACKLSKGALLTGVSNHFPKGQKGKAKDAFWDSLCEAEAVVQNDSLILNLKKAKLVSETNFQD